jgi:hypothetical protein
MIPVVYLLVRCLLSCLMVLTRHQVSKDAELLVLRRSRPAMIPARRQAASSDRRNPARGRRGWPLRLAARTKSQRPCSPGHSEEVARSSAPDGVISGSRLHPR